MENKTAAVQMRDITKRFGTVLANDRVWLDIYKLYHWEHFYSFPLYIILAASIRRLTQFLMRQQIQAKEKTPGQGS